MSEQFASYNLGISWNVFGNQREADLDKLLDSRADLTPVSRSELVHMWKMHPHRQRVSYSQLTIAPTKPALSPRVAYAVYVLVLRDIDGVVHLLGTAYAVTTPSQTVAMTCAHCVWTRNEAGVDCRRTGELLLVSRVVRTDTNTFSVAAEEFDECFRMNPIHRDTRDICLLQIDTSCKTNSSTTFRESIPVCPSALMPRSSREEYDIKVYQAPMATFAYLDLPSLDIDVGEWTKATMVQDYYYYGQTVSAAGSSGGPVLNSKGCAVGIVQSGYLPALSVDLLPHDPDVDAAAQWSGTVSNNGQMAHYTKIIKIDHPAFLDILARA